MRLVAGEWSTTRRCCPFGVESVSETSAVCQSTPTTLEGAWRATGHFGRPLTRHNTPPRGVGHCQNPRGAPPAARGLLSVVSGTRSGGDCGVHVRSHGPRVARLLLWAAFPPPRWQALWQDLFGASLSRPSRAPRRFLARSLHSGAQVKQARFSSQCAEPGSVGGRLAGGDRRYAGPTDERFGA